MTLQSMETERKHLGMEWDKYILYHLDIDRDDINDGALEELATIIEELAYDEQLKR